MRIDQIRTIATQQKNWIEGDGILDFLDIKAGKMGLYLIDENDTIKKDHNTYKISGLPMNQMVNRLKLAGTFRELNEYPDILQQAIDIKVSEMQNSTRRAKTRLIFDPTSMTVKAAKTDRYERVHNLDIINYTISKHPELSISDRSYIDDHGMKLIAFNGEQTETTAVGDLFRAGIEIQNSEIDGGFFFQQHLERLKCKNGASIPIFDTPARLAHVHADIWSRITDLYQNIDYGVVMELFNKATTRPVVFTTAKELMDQLKVYHIPSMHHEKILNTINESDFDMDVRGNAWDAYNRITYYTSHETSMSPWLVAELNSYAYEMMLVM